MNSSSSFTRWRQATWLVWGAVDDNAQAVHFQRCVPAAQRPFFLMGSPHTGQRRARTDLVLTTRTIPHESQAPNRINLPHQKHADLSLQSQAKPRPKAPRIVLYSTEYALAVDLP